MSIFHVKNDGSLSFTPPVLVRSRPKVLSPLSWSFEAEADAGEEGSVGILKPDTEIEALSKMPNHELVEHANNPALSRVHIPASELGLRQSAVVLMRSLEARMRALHVVNHQLSRYEYGQRAQQVFNDIVYELIRQIAVQSGERAKLLATVWVRSNDIMNSLTRLFVVEHGRHEQEETKLREDLKKSRKDYLLVVERLESLIREQHQSQTLLLAEADGRENDLCKEIDNLKNELYFTTLKLRNLAEESQRVGQAPARPPPELGSPKGEEYDTSGEDPRVTIANLKADLQRQKVLMLEATGEATKLKDSAPCKVNVGVMALPDTHDAAVDPVEELVFGSSDDDDDSPPIASESFTKSNVQASAKQKKRK